MSKDWETESANRKAAIAATLAEMKLTVESKFVPFSQSRNKDSEHKSLNWRITLKRDGKVILTTDYQAGLAHCPGCQVNKAPSEYRGKDRRRMDGTPYPGTTSSYRRPTEAERLSDFREEICALECEGGFAMEYNFQGQFKQRRTKKKADEYSTFCPILPDSADVIYSLVMDSSVIDFGTFEDWASEFGYDPDSWKGESIYNACLEIALELRGAIGKTGLATLQNAFQDY